MGATVGRARRGKAASRFLGPYRSLLTTPGSRAFVTAGLVGRFPLSMLGLSAVLFVSAVSGSYTLGGAVSAALALSSGGAAPLVGSAADRRGQRPVLLACLAAHVAGTAGLLCAAALHAPAWTLFPPAVLAGAGTPPTGSFVRTRWTSLVGGTPALSTALSLESVFDEVVFVVGPVLATSLSALLWPGAGLVAAALLATAGNLWLATQHATAPAPVTRPAGAARASAMRVPAMRAVAVVFVVVGAAFGACDVSMVAFAREHGAPVAAGLLLAAIACGSLVAGLLYGTVHWVRPLHQRFLLGLAGLAAAFAPFAIVPSIPLMAVAAAVAGLAVAPTLVPGIGLVEARVPTTARTEGFAWIGTAIATGAATGAYLAGRAVDTGGAHRAFLVVVAAALLSLLAGLAAAGAMRPVTGRGVEELGATTD